MHPVQEDLGRNWPLDLGIVSDEAAFLSEALSGESAAQESAIRGSMSSRAPARNTKKTITDQYVTALKYSRDTNHIHPTVIAKEVHDFLYKGSIDPKQTVTGWGGWTIGNSRRTLAARETGRGSLFPAATSTERSVPISR